MPRVRLDTAYGHILLSGQAARNDGLQVLDQTARQASQYGMSHQLRSIEGIRRTYEGPTGPDNGDQGEAGDGHAAVDRRQTAA